MSDTCTDHSSNDAPSQNEHSGHCIVFSQTKSFYLFIMCIIVYAVLAALVRFFLTTTGFWLLRIALARRREAWGNKPDLNNVLKPIKNASHIHVSAHRGEAHHAQVLPVVVLANDVPQAVEGGTGILVDRDLYVRVGRFVLACGSRGQNEQIYPH